MKKVYILMTRLPDPTSLIIRMITGFHYTHVSIGLEEDPNVYYSFVFKGFIVEKISRYLSRQTEPFPCQLMELPVRDEVYEDLKEIIHDFQRKKPFLHYTRTGVVLSLFHVMHHWENHYYCSQFVAEVLEKSKAMKLKKDSSIFLPKDFTKTDQLHDIFEGNLREYAKEFHLV